MSVCTVTRRLGKVFYSFCRISVVRNQVDRGSPPERLNAIFQSPRLVRARRVVCMLDNTRVAREPALIANFRRGETHIFADQK